MDENPPVEQMGLCVQSWPPGSAPTVLAETPGQVQGWEPHSRGEGALGASWRLGPCEREVAPLLLGEVHAQLLWFILNCTETGFRELAVFIKSSHCLFIQSASRKGLRRLKP